jgi:hypothetical protein
LAISRISILYTGGDLTDGSKEESKEKEVALPYFQVSSFPQARFPKRAFFSPHNGVSKARSQGATSQGYNNRG